MNSDSIKNFSDMAQLLQRRAHRQRAAIVCCYDQSTLYAVERALNEGFADIILVGERNSVPQSEVLEKHAAHVSYVEATTPDEAARCAVALVREGKADVLMKGLINTDNLLRAVLNKEEGILPRGRVLTHIAAAQMPGREGLVFFSDAAVIPYPTHEQRLAQVGYMAALCHACGIEEPRIALNHCSEKVNEKFPHTVGYAEIRQRAEQGEWGKAIVDGPLDVLTAFDAEACKVKGIKSPIGGQANALIFPDIEAGNAFYKTLTCFAGAEIAGMLQGAACPVVLSSRGDSPLSKYYSLAMAAASNG